MLREKSKIQIVRDEFTRIGCDQTSWVKPFDVFWTFHNIIVRGRKVAELDFEALCVLLKTLPDNAGEDAFWNLIEKTDLEKLYKKLDEKNMREFRKMISKTQPKKKTKRKAKKKVKSSNIKK